VQAEVWLAPIIRFAGESGNQIGDGVRLPEVELKNIVLLAFRFFEFLHSQGHSRPIPPIMADILCQLRPVRVRTGVARNM
jgi:hypothetical protein